MNQVLFLDREFIIISSMIVSYNNQQTITKPYKKVNAYQIRPPFKYFLTIILFILQLVLHSIFIPKAVLQIGSPILIIIWALNYVILSVIFYDYFYITCRDPVDKILIKQDYAKKIPQKQLFLCHLCERKVHVKSYHCRQCDRCTQNFDHHCQFLNSCIGSRNYEQFLRFILMNILFDLFCIIQAIWVISIDESWSKWGSISLIVISSVIFLPLCLLVAFHIYQNCCYITTSVQSFKRKQIIKNKEDQININEQQQGLQSQHYLGKRDKNIT